MKGKGRWILLVVVAAAVVGAIGWRARRADTSKMVGPITRVVPESLRIRVEVMNGAGTRGLARRATAAMRDAGFDVVGSGNWTERLDSSLVVVRNGRMDWGALAAEALGGARVIARPDSSRYLDLTIVVGAAWRPPSDPFDP